MIEEKYIEWMHLALDGKLSRKYVDQLELYLQKNKEARELYEQLRQTTDILNRTEEIEPPADLKKRIMNNIDFSRYAPAEPKTSRKKGFADWFYQPRAKMVYAFAAGLLLGLLALIPILSKQPRPDVSDLVGAIGSYPDSPFQTIQEFPVGASGINGKIEIKKYQNLIITAIKLKSNNSANLSIEFDPAFLQWHQLFPRTVDAARMNYNAGRFMLSFSHSTEISLSFLQLQPHAQLTLRLTLAGNPVLDKTVVVE